uniref:Glycosyltransferase n=1 Tax=Cyclamen persicum TaxID=87530 RepID=A7M6K0_9ERIC|nr:glucosyltransferase [Cyclamen persicum]
MKRKELVFIPPPFMGHMTQMVELAKLMVERDDRLVVTFLIIELPLPDPVGSSAIKSFGQTPKPNCPGQKQEQGHESEQNNIKFVHLPVVDPDPEWDFKTVGVLHSLILDHQKPYIREIVSSFPEAHDTELAGFVFDMLCTPVIEVANEIGVPGYVFFASNAAFLGLMLHLQDLHDHHNQDVSELRYSKSDLVIPSYAVPVPPSVLPFVLIDKRSWITRFIRYARDFRKAKAIMVNTFSDVEPYALESLSSLSVPVYPIGPILSRTHLKEYDHDQANITRWLDDQPAKSVVFLCFGSRGGFPDAQVTEIAEGVERSGHRFLWSIRQPASKDKAEFPGKYSLDGLEVLPEGFLDRTAGKGKVINGWVGQLQVLAHPAVGGFVSHCGWNSILESIWCGVPTATLPIYAEQQVNAFQMVRDLGLSAEISLDYHQHTYDHDLDTEMIVTASQVERGIRLVMEAEDGCGNELRNKVKDMSEKARTAVADGGSSYVALRNLINKEVIGATALY